MAAYVDGIIVFDSDPMAHVKNIYTLLGYSRKHSLMLSLSNARLGGRMLIFLVTLFRPPVCVRTRKRVSINLKVLIPASKKLLHDFSKRIRPITTLPKKEATVLSSRHHRGHRSRNYR